MTTEPEPPAETCLDPEIADRWLERLEKAKGKANGFLRDEKNRPCALGCLCDAADPEGWTRIGPGYVWHHRGKIGRPVVEVLIKAGVSQKTCDYIQRKNDTGMSLKLLAILIRKLPRRAAKNG